MAQTNPQTLTPPKPQKTLRRYLSLDDFEQGAQRHLPRPIFGYIGGAAERNESFDDNQRAYAEYRFVTRVLRDVSKRSQSTTLFGRTWSAPFGIAPMGISALSAYRGDLVLAQAAQRAGIPMIMSGSSLIRLEAVAQVAPQTWFQAYLPGESAKIHALVERVERAGYQTLVLTVDTAVLANRENNVRAGFSTPLKPSLRLAMDGLTHPRWLFGTAVKTLVKHGMPHFENSYATRGAPIFSGRVARDFGAKDHLNWTHVDEIRRQWKGTLIIKGVLAPDDARAACDHGIDGIIVSNHGGRQLDGAVAPLRVLPAIAAAVGAQMPVMIDGGIRRGTDVLKALALGADFVFVGRPFNYAAAVAGEAGVDHAIAILRTEVQRNLGLLGLNALDELGPHLLMRVGASEQWQQA
ncbi:alpha-hydroxy acid oxidase [Trinickia diaoshuihuensis]|uniref:alpha-hydroxy acid oxidase n=1 Tax=Trinickia diaoshuihuensis TaxID=2292265 RepID=UPI000E26365D|nr:alpha-hydroxy acid oxidase [Trinickia diaoshuihuensis]